MKYLVYLALGALTWIGVYTSMRRPRRPSDQYRESPMFEPKRRWVAIACATVVSGLFLAYLLMNAPQPR